MAMGSTLNGGSIGYTSGISAFAQGGAGGQGQGVGNRGGDGAGATASASATAGAGATGFLNIFGTEVGGAGGFGGEGADGGNGAAITLGTGIVSGSTSNLLILTQTATGGDGGYVFHSMSA